MRIPTLRARTFGAALPLAVAVAVLTATPAAATVDAASFFGGFTSTCTLPYDADGDPTTGAYTCNHRATSVGCAAVVDAGAVVTYVKLCQANLTSGRTQGSATPAWGGYWRCDNGAGTGSFTYRPSTSESLVFTFPVNLIVQGHEVVVSGSYTQAGTGRHVVVRATFPAVCAASTNLPTGYEGTVAPV